MNRDRDDMSVGGWSHLTAFTTEADCRMMTSGATVFRILSKIAGRHQTALWDGEIMSDWNINVSLLNWNHIMSFVIFCWVVCLNYAKCSNPKESTSLVKVTPVALTSGKDREWGGKSTNETNCNVHKNLKQASEKKNLDSIFWQVN